MSKVEAANHSHAGQTAEMRAKGSQPTRPFSYTRFLLVTIVLLVAINGLLYMRGSTVVQVQARSLAGSEPGSSAPQLALQRWNLMLTLTSLLTGIGVALFSGVGFRLYRQKVLSEVDKQIDTSASSAGRLALVKAELDRVVIENSQLNIELNRVRGDLDARVDERVAVLAKAHAQLEAELNERKQAEKALARQAQELGRSKDVLELHVQARTHELQKLKSRYESILNSAGEGIYGLDPHGRMTFVNPAAARITGWNIEELSGRSEEDTFGVYGTAAWPASLNGLPSEQIFLRKDGASFPVEYVRTPIVEKDKVVGAAVIFKDITERKKTEETLSRKAAELARSNAELEQFAYVASHDLQEPLRKIQAFGDRLKSKCDAANLQDGREYLERMQSAAARMQKLIEDLLTFSRVISATQPFVPVDLGVVTHEVLTDLEVRIEQSKAKVELGSLPTIEADPLQMRQLLQNLIGNALKFQPPDSQPVIKIYAEIRKSPFADAGQPLPTDELCELTIEDNGIGFEEKYLDKIFSVFQRLHGRTEYEGTGVGLAVCRRITDRHSGTITARSEPGKGAKFLVTLPVRHPRQPSQEKPS
jgi:two-component system sensor kinase FixL